MRASRPRVGVTGVGNNRAFFFLASKVRVRVVSCYAVLRYQTLLSMRLSVYNDKKKENSLKPQRRT